MQFIGVSTVIIRLLNTGLTQGEVSTNPSRTGQVSLLRNSQKIIIWKTCKKVHILPFGWVDEKFQNVHIFDFCTEACRALQLQLVFRRCKPESSAGCTPAPGPYLYVMMGLEAIINGVQVRWRYYTCAPLRSSNPSAIGADGTCSLLFTDLWIDL